MQVRLLSLFFFKQPISIYVNNNMKKFFFFSEQYCHFIYRPLPPVLSLVSVLRLDWRFYVSKWRKGSYIRDEAFYCNTRLRLEIARLKAKPLLLPSSRQVTGRWMALACLEFISLTLTKSVAWTQRSLKTAGEERTGNCWTGERWRNRK